MTCSGNRIDRRVAGASEIVETHIRSSSPSVASDAAPVISQPWLTASTKGSLAFLLNYAHPQTRSLASAFAVDHTEGSDNGAVYDEQDLFVPEVFSSDSPNSLFQYFLGELGPTDLYPPDDLIDWQVFSNDPASPLLLQNMTNNLIDELTHFTTSSSQPAGNSPPIVDLSLFTARKVQSLVDEYFRRWNHHSPVIHAATFDATTVETPLLLAICLTSALLSSDPKDVSAATCLLDIAEAYIFEHRSLQWQLEQPSAVTSLTDALPAIQAAFSIAQIQLRHGTSMKRSSIRNHRFKQLIKASRKLHPLLDSGASQFVAASREQFDWCFFGAVQAGVRLAFGIYNLDVSFTIFYNEIPRLFVEEMLLPLPCDLSAFTAPTADMCYDSLRASAPGSPKFVSDWLDILGTEQSTSAVEDRQSPIDTLHLFIIILGKFIRQRHTLGHADAIQKPSFNKFGCFPIAHSASIRKIKSSAHLKAGDSTGRTKTIVQIRRTNNGLALYRQRRQSSGWSQRLYLRGA